MASVEKLPMLAAGYERLTAELKALREERPLIVDAIEGNDRFFIESTSEDVAIEVVGGLGSDTFNVGGSNGEAVVVVSNNLEGHSGLVLNTVDSNDPDYNTMVSAPHPYSHESLRRADPLYDLILITDWNWPYATAGRGSAIFLHRWRKPCHPTAGCVGFAPADLLWIANRLQPQSRLITRG